MENGHTEDMSLPEETVDFIIGGRAVKARALSLWDLETSREDVRSLGPDLFWTEYAAAVVRILVRQQNPDNPDLWKPKAEAMLKACSAKEAQSLAGQMNKLLTLSGFGDDGSGEAEAAESPGTGTSTESSQNSPSPSETQTGDGSNVI